MDQRLPTHLQEVVDLQMHDGIRDQNHAQRTEFEIGLKTSALGRECSKCRVFKTRIEIDNKRDKFS